MKLTNTLHILPGPVYSSGEAVRVKYEKLSEFSCGSIISLGPKRVENKFGNYNLRLTGTNERYDTRSNFRLFVAALREARILKKTTGLDIVICYDPLKTGLISYLIKKLYGCKMIVEVNGVYSAPALYSFKKGLLIKIKKLAYPMIQKFILRSADGIKCLYEGQLLYKVPVGRQIIKCFFNFTQVDQSKYFFNENKKILSIGYPSYIKGMDVLVSAFNIVAKKYPEWTLELVGYFSEGDRDLLNNLVEDKKRVSIRKPIDFTEVPALIDECNIFVLASRTEAMGRVLLEAMARGRARIASNVGGIPAIVDSGHDGLLFESQNVNDLVLKLEELMGSESKRKKIAEAGLQRFKNEFTVEYYSDRVAELYEEVCQLN